MPSGIEEFLALQILAFALCFTRIGTTLMIMPGIGDSFTPAQIRLNIAIAMSLVLFPLMVTKIPQPLPGVTNLLLLIMMEMIIGLFFGTVARVMMMALDTAGMVISTMSGLANAQVFNPSLATQGSIMGAFMSVTGVVVLFALNLHHLLIMGIVDSYNFFPIGTIPDTSGMAEFMAGAVTKAFAVGIQIGAPFIVLTLLVYVGMGVLTRLMPQVQVFLLALPLQILLSLMLLIIVLTASFEYWGTAFEEFIVFFLSNTG